MVSHSRTHPTVSVIVVNWNGQSLLQECLGALHRQTYRHFEIIFVDNGSTDASVALVRAQFPEVRVMALGDNKGFAGGNLEGFKVAHGAFIALLNNDTCVTEQWLEHLIQPMRDNPNVGLCASKLLVAGTDMINSAGDGITTAGVGYNRGSGKNRRWYEHQEPVFGPCGGAGLYRRTMLEDIGFLDEEFFLNDEDTDLNFRAQLAGWRCCYVPTAVVDHKINGTIGRLSDLHVYYHVRNLECLWVKNMPLGLMLRFAHHKLVHEIGSFCYLCLRHGKWRPFFHGKVDAMKLLPVMLEKRRAIQRTKRLSNHDVRKLLTPLFRQEVLRQKMWQLFRG